MNERCPRVDGWGDTDGVTDDGERWGLSRTQTCVLLIQTHTWNVCFSTHHRTHGHFQVSREVHRSTDSLVFNSTFIKNFSYWTTLALVPLFYFFKKDKKLVLRGVKVKRDRFNTPTGYFIYWPRREVSGSLKSPWGTWYIITGTDPENHPYLISS